MLGQRLMFGHDHLVARPTNTDTDHCLSESTELSKPLVKFLICQVVLHAEEGGQTACYVDHR